MTAEPGSWGLVLLGGLAGQAARVAEADRGRAALLATVSHDLRAPLAAAKEESLDRLAHLAASLLDVSRLQAGARAVFPRPAPGGGLTMVLTLPAAPRPAAEPRGTRRIRAA